jgi:hypothetical protein
MSRQNAASDESFADVDRLVDLRRAVRGSNINEETLLATDYLNHFNEAIMLLELVTDMPELIDEVKAWRPKTYQQHFHDSGLSIGDLAIEAYKAAPLRYRRPFDATVEEANLALLAGVEEVEHVLRDGNTAIVGEVISTVVATVQSCNDRAGAIINASTPNPADVEQPSQQESMTDAGSVLDQDDIDALFD